MTVLDVNVLLYAHNLDAPQHSVISAWLGALFRGYETIGLSWPTIWAFLRISTDRRLLPKPLTPADAFRVARTWLAQPRIVIIHPGPRHLELLERLVIEGQASGPLLSDATLAAIAIENGATLASTDRDFSRFPNLRWLNPLA